RGGLKVSRQAGCCRAAVLLLALAMVGCATTSEVTAQQRLQARAAYERGLSHLQDKQSTPALTAFQEAIAIDGQEPLYRNTLGLLLLQLRQPNLALEQFRNATELDGSSAEAHLNMGIALAEMTRWEEAVTAYRRAIVLPTLSAPHVAYQNLGLALYHLKR